MRLDFFSEDNKKLFTQEDVDRIVSNRLKREDKNKIENLDLQNELEENKNLNNVYKERIEELEKINLCFKKGLGSDEIDYALYKAAKDINEDESFSSVLDRIMENDNYFNKTQITGLKQSSNVEIDNGIENDLEDLFGIKFK